MAEMIGTLRLSSWPLPGAGPEGPPPPWSISLPPRHQVRLIDAEPETRFEVGSITKGLTGMLLADAIDRGEVSLDTTIGDLLPGE